MIRGSVPITTLFLGVSWKGRRGVWAAVEGTSIIVKGGETEAAADLSEHRTIRGGLRASPCLGEREGQRFRFPQKETGPGGQEALRPALLPVSARNSAPPRALPVSPFSQDFRGKLLRPPR